MIENPIRRGQLIAPFGVGAMVVGKGGVAMVTGALDYWYRRSDERSPSEDSLREFRVDEWRLQKRLGVDHFRLPPDWRERQAGGDEVPNAFLTIPFLTFPTWFSCRKCGRMEQAKPSDRKAPACPECGEKGWFSRMVQVPIVAVCSKGHLMEFPWKAWVHRGQEGCAGKLKLVSRSGATLASKVVKCSCGKERTLSGVTARDKDGMTTVSRELIGGGEPYLCRGNKAWAGANIAEECDAPIQGSLRSALNVYYADVQSALYLPIGSGSVPPELMALIEQPAKERLKGYENLLAKGRITEDEAVDEVVSLLIQGYPTLDTTYSRSSIKKAVMGILKPETLSSGAEDQFSNEVVFRHEERLALRSDRKEEDLLTRVLDTAKYGRIADYLSCVTLVEKLKETRVLNGFTRVVPPQDDSFALRQRLMWIRPPDPSLSWLPAQVVYGEGIYIELNEECLQEWEERDDVKARVERLIDEEKGITPRMMLVHTLSHLLMNQLTFSCGYSSATLRERLYVSVEDHTRMGGVLIYTAEGDADGTLGGLVRMGKPENFAQVFEQALANAQWCSADPVCIEAGAKGGQGPGSSNLSACHSCALVPETACEQFNRYLDRALVVGTPEHPELGFFGRLLQSILPA